MTSFTVPIAIRHSSIRPADRPLVWIGMDKADRLLTDDQTVFGLRRMVLCRKGEPPDLAVYLDSVQSRTEAEVSAWCVERDDGFYYLWMVWKD